MKTPFQPSTLGRVCAIALLTTTAALAQAATGDVTRGAVAVTTTMGSYNNTDYALDHVIDQSGLSTPYVSGTTTFDTFVAGTTSNYGTGASAWYSASGITKGLLSFDLGASYTIDGLAWFSGSDNYRATGIKVYADDDGNVTNGNTGLLFTSGAIDSPAGSNNGAVKPNVFSFSSGAATRYVSIEILGGAFSGYVGVGEVVFSQATAVAAVPEPGTYALFGLGLLGVGAARRRRMAQR